MRSGLILQRDQLCATVYLIQPYKWCNQIIHVNIIQNII